MLYAYAKLSEIDLGIVRVGGPGLGNLLFPWARFAVAVERYGLTPLATTWPQIKVGPLLRREPDPRMYRGLFDTPPGHVRGLRRWRALRALPRVPEQEFAVDPTIAGDCAVVVFEGMAGFFQPILGTATVVRDALESMTRPVHRTGMAFDFSGSIVVHVRLGDFQPPRKDALVRGSVSTRIPIEWYCGVVTRLRRSLRAARVYVFSDGSDADLAGLLALPDVRRMGFGSAVADLLAMARAPLLVASGSTFSMWASYLGRMPVVWHTGQLRQRLYPDLAGAEIEAEDDDSPLPPDFLDLAARNMEERAR